MTIDKIKQAAEIAKSRTNDKRWNAAIDKAVAGVESGWWIVTELHNCLAITTETGKTYFANGVCQCEAYQRSTACKHRSLYRLYQIANEIEETAPVAVSRPELIAGIKSAWSRKYPTDNLADNLMARFKKNSLEMLSVDFLEAIHATL